MCNCLIIFLHFLIIFWVSRPFAVNVTPKYLYSFYMIYRSFISYEIMPVCSNYHMFSLFLISTKPNLSISFRSISFASSLSSAKITLSSAESRLCMFFLINLFSIALHVCVQFTMYILNKVGERQQPLFTEYFRYTFSNFDYTFCSFVELFHCIYMLSFHCC